MSKDSVVIVDGARTPMGGLQGSLAAASAPEPGHNRNRSGHRTQRCERGRYRRGLYGLCTPGRTKARPRPTGGRSAQAYLIQPVL